MVESPEPAVVLFALLGVGIIWLITSFIWNNLSIVLSMTGGSLATFLALAGGNYRSMTLKLQYPLNRLHFMLNLQF